MEVETITENCPYCKEIISAGAIKCKHCGEWLEKKEIAIQELDDTIEEKSGLGFSSRIIPSIILTALGWLLYHFGGWVLIFNEEISLATQIFSIGRLEVQNLIIRSDAFIFRVNETYYGFVNDTRFFDSPFIQWIMLICAIITFAHVFMFLLFGD